MGLFFGTERKAGRIARSNRLLLNFPAALAAFAGCSTERVSRLLERTYPPAGASAQLIAGSSSKASGCKNVRQSLGTGPFASDSRLAATTALTSTSPPAPRSARVVRDPGVEPAATVAPNPPSSPLVIPPPECNTLSI